MLKVLNFLRIRQNISYRRLFHREEIIEINGYNINTVQVGEGEKTVFLLPGTLGTFWTDFEPQIENLPKLLPDHKIIAWDPPGCGKSVPPERVFNENCFKNDAKLAVELLRKIGCLKCSMLGWSAGSMTAIIIAARYPELVDKLVIWGSSAYVNEHGFLMSKEFRNVQKAFSPAMRERYEKVYGTQRYAELWKKCMDNIANIYLNHNGNICREETKRVRAPTFLLHGKKDLVSPKTNLKFFFENLPCYKYYEFPEGKHNIHLKFHNEFNEMVVDFLLQDSEKLIEDFKDLKITFK